MKKNTYFCDIDGTIFKYRKFESMLEEKAELVHSVAEQLATWHKGGHHIVLTTARPEDLRDHTISELSDHNIKYHQLVMGIGRGIRYVINDIDPEKQSDRAFGINLIRDKGFK